MSGLLFIPFAVFFACALGQFVLLRRVRQALIERHSDIWLELSRKAWSVDSALSRLVWGRRLRALNDPELTNRLNHLMILYAVGIGAWVVFMGVMLFDGAAVRAG